MHIVRLIRQYMQDLMCDKRNDPLSQVVKACLLILSYMYGFLLKAHHFFYKVNLFKSYKPFITVISVGNITLGGTGKTPFTIMLAERLAQRDKKKTAVLIRGYGEDEWKMLKDRLGKQNIMVFVGRDRVKYANEALRYRVSNLILDDGFQHLRLSRDLDILLLDSTNPFGNKHLFPRGILREPLQSLRRADIIVLTKVDRGFGKAGDKTPTITDEIEKIAPGKCIIKACHRPKILFDIRTGGEKEFTFITGKMVCILSAICDPSYFRQTLEHGGALIGLEFAFPDHYSYRVRDLKRIFKECKRKNIDTVITTEKDAVKLVLLRAPKGRSNLNGIASSPSLGGVYPERSRRARDRSAPGNDDYQADSCQILALRIELEITEGEEKLNDCLHRLHMRGPGQDT